jgi:hypothetical protein
MSASPARPAGKARLFLALALPALLFLSPASPLSDQKSSDVPGLLRQIRDEVLELGKYPGEDFARGEFFLGFGDDDTNKTHAVGILVKDEAEGTRMTIVVSRLEPSRDDPRVKYTREPKTIVCRFPAAGVEVVRSEYSAADLEKLLTDVVRAVVDKKNLLKK